MNLRFDTSLIRNYKSASQIARVLTVDWLARNMYYPTSGSLPCFASRYRHLKISLSLRLWL
ncbi:MAG: hypothetical protein J6Q59_00945 [Paludibacteraceae bacterium]|nr:hypothetical protein [Paludibacteraceae bacterium]